MFEDNEYRIYVRFNNQDYAAQRVHARMLREIAQALDDGVDIINKWDNKKQWANEDNEMVAFVAFIGPHSIEIGSN